MFQGFDVRLNPLVGRHARTHASGTAQIYCDAMYEYRGLPGGGGRTMGFNLLLPCYIHFREADCCGERYSEI